MPKRECAASENVPSEGAPSKDSDQLVHSRSMIRIVNGRILDSHGGKVSGEWPARVDALAAWIFH